MKYKSASEMSLVPEQEMSAYNAAATFASLPELVEIMLTFTDIDTVCIARLVSRLFQGLIDGSQALKTIMFGAPHYDAKKHMLGSLPCGWRRLLSHMAPRPNVSGVPSYISVRVDGGATTWNHPISDFYKQMFISRPPLLEVTYTAPVRPWVVRRTKKISSNTGITVGHLHDVVCRDIESGVELINPRLARRFSFNARNSEWLRAPPNGDGSEESVLSPEEALKLGGHYTISDYP